MLKAEVFSPSLALHKFLYYVLWRPGTKGAVTHIIFSTASGRLAASPNLPG